MSTRRHKTGALLSSRFNCSFLMISSALEMVYQLLNQDHSGLNSKELFVQELSSLSHIEQ